MVEYRPEPGMPALGHAPELDGRILFFIVIMDVEMVRLQNLEIVALVPDLVLTEILCMRVHYQQANRQQGQPCLASDPLAFTSHNLLLWQASNHFITDIENIRA
jgi:hypothetical protein